MTPHPRLNGLRAIALAILTVSSLGSAQAAPIVIDSFAAPKPPKALAKPGLATIEMRQTGSSIVGGVRDTAYKSYLNPLATVSAISVGAGQLSVAAGPGALGETLLSYGAFSRINGPDVQGPALGLDLRKKSRMELTFSGVEGGVNIYAELYTTLPLVPAPGGSLDFYQGAGTNVTPTTPGAPITVVLDFGKNPTFNYASVDGLYIVIDRSGYTNANSYVLTNVRFLDD